MKALFKKVSQIIMLVPMMALILSAVTPLAAYATDEKDCTTVGGGVASGAQCVAPQGARANLFGEGGVFMTVTNILIFIIGAVAVVMLIIGGIRYTLSQGDQSAITSAKNTILYAIIGIVVAVLAFGAVNFITSQLPTGADT
ncbi:MAG TPA: pilin [Candidatus Saccharimonadales bacterium]|nr:pilin [Candidatus Saccharimonadales bacterium]